MSEIRDRLTGKPLDLASDALPTKLKECCDECGTQLISRCLSCGAPVCCPKCCADDAGETL